jgi:hypothetical protein
MTSALANHAASESAPSSGAGQALRTGSRLDAWRHPFSRLVRESPGFSRGSVKEIAHHREEFHRRRAS